MPRRETGKAMLALRAIAMRRPDTTEGIACPGTAMERRTVKVNDKAFLFVGVADAMVKLGASLDEAKRLAARAPDRFQVGKTAWVKLMFDDAHPPPAELARRWIAESHALVGGATTKPAKTVRTRKR